MSTNYQNIMRRTDWKEGGEKDILFYDKEQLRLVIEEELLAAFNEGIRRGSSQALTVEIVVHEMGQ